MEQHIESAEKKLNDENLIAFGIVAIRDVDGDRQGASQRAIDPEYILEHPDESDVVIDKIHQMMVSMYEEDLKERDLL